MCGDDKSKKQCCVTFDDEGQCCGVVIMGRQCGCLPCLCCNKDDDKHYCAIVMFCCQVDMLCPITTAICVLSCGFCEYIFFSREKETTTVLTIF